MKPITAFCCDALINPFFFMVEASRAKYVLTYRLLRILGSFMAGGFIAQALGSLVAYFAVEDPQVAGMIAHLLIEKMSYYFLGCCFVILSLSNILIRRGLIELKRIRLPSLVQILTISTTSFLLIPRMDYLRELALQDGMPIRLSPLANYFTFLNVLTFSMLCLEIVLGILITWRLSDLTSS